MDRDQSSDAGRGERERETAATRHAGAGASRDPGAGPGDPAPDLVLAALARAELHAGRRPAPVPVWTLLAHLDLAPRSPPARAVRARLGELEREGLIATSKRHSVPVFACTESGARRLARLRRRRAVPQLPESPQHARWRRAHTLAGQEAARYRARLDADLLHARTLLEAQAAAERPVGRRQAPARPSSDEWFVLARRLRRACRRVGSASYVLHEWPEPRDDRADVDDLEEGLDGGLDAAERARRRAARAGRRNPLLWSEP